MVCTLIDHRNGIKMFKTLQLNHSPVRLWLVCRGSTRVDKSTDHAGEIVVDLLKCEKRAEVGERQKQRPFSQICTSHFLVVCFRNLPAWDPCTGQKITE